MQSKRKGPFRLLVIIALGAGLALAAASSGRRCPDDKQRNDECLSCHMQTFSAGLGRRTLHAPFFDKCCIGCHLETGSPVPGAGGQAGHPPLRDRQGLTIDACYGCHPPSRMGLSHPVGVYAQGGGTLVPDDLPTIKGGMITCVTCHGPHGSSEPGLTRELIAARVCLACHVGG